MLNKSQTKTTENSTLTSLSINNNQDKGGGRYNKLNSLFIILNLIFAIIAFSYLVSAQMPGDVETFAPTSTMPLATGAHGATGAWLQPGEPLVEKTIGGYLTDRLINDFFIIASWTGLGYIVGELAGGEEGELWGAVSGLSGALTYSLLHWFYGPGNAVFTIGQFIVTPAIAGIGVGLIVFALTYKQTSTGVVEFNCLPYEPPIGGDDCERCNDFESCTEYTCKSLGQACELVNKGTEHEKCIWANPHDVTSPVLRITVPDPFTTIPFNSVRPPATGVEIKHQGNCVPAFTPLEFTIISDEPSQCKIDYNLTSFEQMSYYVGDNIFSYNHTEELSLPGPDAINAEAPELQNDGVYTLYSICQDANGNKNENAFAIRFCVDPGPDLTPPVIDSISIPSGAPVQYNQSSLEIEVYVNEPAECKWSHQDLDYNQMENTMICNNQLWQMNNLNTYTCKTTLTGIQSREENNFFFKCKDQPGAEESDRNENTKSTFYTIMGTQPLTILETGPTGITAGATDTIPVTLTIKTDNGYNNGEATCYYSTTQNEADYIEFLTTGGNEHEQRQDLMTGEYTYYFKCVDLGGNAAYDSTSFTVISDRQEPTVVRVYKESNQLKIITNEKAECTYSFRDCNFKIADGITMTTYNGKDHKAEWKSGSTFNIRCKDDYGNQPNPNTCSIVVRPFEVE